MNEYQSIYANPHLTSKARRKIRKLANRLCGLAMRSYNSLKAQEARHHPPCPVKVCDEGRGPRERFSGCCSKEHQREHFKNQRFVARGMQHRGRVAKVATGKTLKAA